MVAIPASFNCVVRGLFFFAAVGAFANAICTASSADLAAACSPARRLPPVPKT